MIGQWSYFCWIITQKLLKLHFGINGGGSSFLLSLHSLHSAIYYTVLLCSLQAASQVGALDVGYKPGVTKDELKGVKFLYLLGEVSRPLSMSHNNAACVDVCIPLYIASSQVYHCPFLLTGYTHAGFWRAITWGPPTRLLRCLSRSVKLQQKVYHDTQ